MTMSYHKATYLDGYEIVFPLSEYGDYETQFFRVYYYIDRNYYRPKIVNWTYPAMERITSESGLPVMRKIKDFPYANYRLLREETTQIEGTLNLILVAETYGYTPDKMFKIPTLIAWRRPGLLDTEEGGVLRAITSVSNDPSAREHTLTIDNADNLVKTGDLVNIECPYFNLGGMQWLYRQATTSPVVVLSATQTQIVLPEFTFQMYYNNGNLGPTYSSFDQDASAFYNPLRPKNLITYGSKRAPSDSEFAGYKEISFVTKNPNDFKNSVQAFEVTKGGEAVDTIDSATTPSISEYKAQIGAGNFLVSQQQSWEQLMGDVYTQITYYIPYQ